MECEEYHGDHDRNDLTKVVTVDSFLKATLAILQVVMLALTGWVVTTILDHNDRLTKVEMKQEEHKSRDGDLMLTLREVSQKQNTLLENNSIVRTEIEHLKAQIKQLSGSK